MRLEELHEAARARIGAVLRDRWRLSELLGVGGMAAVYAAAHRNGKRVAVKILHPPLASDPGVRGRFLSEGYVANSIGHPGVVTVDDDDVADDGCPFLVMTLLHGETFERARTEAGGRLPPARVVELAAQVLDVLVAAHARGVIHRDLKPENLFVTAEGAIKVLDFGLARARECPVERGRTIGETLLGTPHYMAPEQALGRWDLVDAATDLWALGATMFTLLTGEHVHGGATVQELLVTAATEPARSLGAVDTALPRALVEVVDRSLSFAKAERFPNARAMLDALIAAAGEMDLPPIALPGPTPQRGRSPSAAALPAPTRTRLVRYGGAAFGLAAIAGLALLFAGRRSPAAAVSASGSAGASSPSANAPVEPSVALTAQPEPSWSARPEPASTSPVPPSRSLRPAPSQRRADAAAASTSSRPPAAVPATADGADSPPKAGRPNALDRRK